jgi:hypothetical protein
VRGMPSSVTVAAALLLTWAIVPPLASGQGLAPPGGGEVDQYFEDLPRAKGERSIDRDARGAPLPPATASELNAGGAEGKAAAELSQATAPGEPIESPTGGAEGDGDSALSGVLESVNPLLWLLLAVTLALGIAWLLWRRRSEG